MNEQLVLIALGIVVAAFVLRPLLRGKTSGIATSPAPADAAPRSDELAELDLDRSMGRISEEDYARWRAELEASAPRAHPDARPASGAAAEAEALVRRWREAPRSVCPTCGERPEPEARYCSNCGAGLQVS